jgi:hypothetical protein
MVSLDFVFGDESHRHTQSFQDPVASKAVKIFSLQYHTLVWKDVNLYIMVMVHIDKARPLKQLEHSNHAYLDS